MIAALVRNSSEVIGNTSELTIGVILIAAGVVAYFVSRAFKAAPSQ
jgi:hypothetical protein